jgi:xylan 1,4-beta-xylosidase
MPGLPLYFTEWSTSYSPRDPVHDSYHCAAYVLTKLKESRGQLQGMSYWTFSDLFEEPGPPTAPFQGNFGLLNPQGIRKPVYFAYKYLNRLGERELDTHDAQSMAVLRDGGVQVLAWHYAPLDQPVSNRPYFTRVHPVADLPPLELALSGLSPGAYEARIYRTGFERNDAYTAYLKLGAPTALTAAQIDELHALTRDEPVVEKLEVDAGGAAQLKVPLREYDVVLVDVQKRAGGP